MYFHDPYSKKSIAKSSVGWKKTKIPSASPYWEALFEPLLVRITDFSRLID